MKRRLHFLQFIAHYDSFSHFLKQNELRIRWNEHIELLPLKYDFHILFIIFLLSFVAFERQWQKDDIVKCHYHYSHRHELPLSDAFSLRCVFVAMLSADLCWVLSLCFVNTYILNLSEKFVESPGTLNGTIHTLMFDIACSHSQPPLFVQRIPCRKSEGNETNANIFCKNPTKMRASPPILAHLRNVFAQNVNWK